MLDLKSDAHYIAGLTDDRIYLGNYVSRKLLQFVDYKHLKIDTLELDYPSYRIAWKSLFITVDSKGIYASERFSPLVISFTQSGQYVNLEDMTRKVQFDRLVPISKSSAIVRSFDPKIKQKVLNRLDYTGDHLRQNRYVLDKQIDGRFCVDGMLLYNSNSATFIYLYYYRNQFVRLDTALNEIYKGQTIDTVSQAQLEIATIEESKLREEKMFSRPPFIVNKSAALSNNYLFVQSALKADNESLTVFKEMKVIDVYSLQSGFYQFSFYLPKTSNGPLLDFKVYKNKLILVLGHFLHIYSLNFEKSLTSASAD